MTYDIEHYPQEGTEEQAGSSPETVRVYTMDAVDTTVVTTLSRWDDDPLTVDKRIATRPRSRVSDTPQRLGKRITNRVEDALDERGFEYEDDQ